jgi:hypothetical protein
MAPAFLRLAHYRNSATDGPPARSYDHYFKTNQLVVRATARQWLLAE